MQKVDPTSNANAIDTNITVDPVNKLVTVEQRNDRFAIRPDTVRLPFDAIKVLCANILLAETGNGPQGAATTAAAGAAPLALRS